MAQGLFVFPEDRGAKGVREDFGREETESGSGQIVGLEGEQRTHRQVTFSCTNVSVEDGCPEG